ncbi:hypothetical protein CkaCkLH20_03162 [Colletotrichum karsti]|uniref:C2H2-type domain-containing protein n=1 Tax=Colletotrichum karsti TaxID=1095194 RepID=A0A9P6IB73_9PEZI|nr:uncharacterized protein CkaCkLH20_03162 [Colletotrichum karsti]KAF9879619.1 hypothetical protein CkaCkLH20_03162 [Colletotrichum karsti]
MTSILAPKNSLLETQQLPVEITTTLSTSAYNTSTQLLSQQPENPFTDGGGDQHAGCDNARLEMSNNVGDEPATTTRSGKKRKIDHGPQTPVESVFERRLACPYLKYDPHTYGQRKGCRGSAYDTVHRMKEHLYRTHQQEPHCSRCGETFDEDEDVAEHRRLEVSCELNEAVSVEGFNASQLKKLKGKRYPPEVKSEEDKWRHVYGILFPNSDKMPDPFYQLFIDGVTCGSGPVPATQRGTWPQFTQGVPSLLEETICELVEKALGKRFSSVERRRVEDALKGSDVMMTWQPREMAAAAEASEASKSESPEVEATGHSDTSERDPRPAESTRSTQPTEAAQSIAMPAIYTSDGLLEGSSDTVPPMFDAQQSSFNMEGMNAGINFGGWYPPLHNATSRNWIWTNDGNQLGSSFGGNSDLFYAQGFASFGTQANGVIAESFVAPDPLMENSFPLMENPLMENHQAGAPAPGPWYHM